MPVWIFLSGLVASEKKIPVELTLLDFAAGQKEAKPGAVLDATLIPLMRELDAILIVIASPAVGGVGFACDTQKYRG